LGVATQPPLLAAAWARASGGFSSLEYGTTKPRSPSVLSYAAKVAKVCCRVSRSAAASAAAFASRSVADGAGSFSFIQVIQVIQV
jgi:hypothetical protein